MLYYSFREKNARGSEQILPVAGSKNSAVPLQLQFEPTAIDNNLDNPRGTDSCAFNLVLSNCQHMNLGTHIKLTQCLLFTRKHQ